MIQSQNQKNFIYPQGTIKIKKIFTTLSSPGIDERARLHQSCADRNKIRVRKLSKLQKKQQTTENKTDKLHHRVSDSEYFIDP